MHGPAQRHGVTQATGNCDFLFADGFSWFGQPCLSRGHAGLVFGEDNLKFAVLGNSAHATGDRLFERLHIKGLALRF